MPRRPAVVVSRAEHRALRRALEEHLGRERVRGDGTTVRLYRNDEVVLLNLVKEAARCRGGFRIASADARDFRALRAAAELAGLDAETVEKLGSAA